MAEGADLISQGLEDYTNLICMRFPDLNEDLNEVCGTIFANKYQRIVRLGQIRMDASPEGSMVVIQNEDQPGVIGNVGTTLGRHQVNIGRFQLGRRDDRAVCLVNIDTPADAAVLEELRVLPNIISVRQVLLD